MENRAGVVVQDATENYKMAQSIEINNYRCFKHLKLSDLRRVNVVVGSNGSGKTALLEALFMACGSSPEIYLKTRVWRGIGGAYAASVREAYESMFNGLFYAFDTNAPLSIRLGDTESGDRELKVYYPAQQTLSLQLKGDGLDSTALTPITFKWKTPNGEHESPVRIEGDELKVTASADVIPGVFVSASAGQVGKDTLERFSRLSKKKQLGPLLDSVRGIYPEVEDITLETGGLYASIAGLPEKMPIGMLSAGITKYVTILTAIAATRRGVVFVDEIENGFYFETLSMIMGSLFQACESAEVQLFASTHSIEFLRSLYPVIRGHEASFCLMRMERRAGTSLAERFSGSELLGALEQRIEVR